MAWKWSHYLCLVEGRGRVGLQGQWNLPSTAAISISEVPGTEEWLTSLPEDSTLSIPTAPLLLAIHCDFTLPRAH